MAVETTLWRDVDCLALDVSSCPGFFPSFHFSRGSLEIFLFHIEDILAVVGQLVCRAFVHEQGRRSQVHVSHASLCQASIKQGDRYLQPVRQQIIRPQAVMGRIISGFRDKRTYLF